MSDICVICKQGCYVECVGMGHYRTLQSDNAAKDERIKELEAELAEREWISVEDEPDQNRGLDGMYPIIVNGGLRLGMYSTISKRWLWQGKAVYPTHYAAIIAIPAEGIGKPVTFLPDCMWRGSDSKCANTLNSRFAKSCSKHCNNPVPEKASE